VFALQEEQRLVGSLGQPFSGMIPGVGFWRYLEGSMEKPRKILVALGAVVIFWIAVTSIIYQFSNPEKTFTQTFLNIPKSVLLDFSD
jgi:hypothetical protein